MATLSQTTKGTKEVLKWGGLSILSILLIYFGIKFGGFLKEIFFPTPPPPPTVSFGKLPNISLPENQKTYTLNYSIDTVTGALPVFEDRINIYKMQKAKQDLLAYQKALEKAMNIGFTSSSVALSNGVYQWEDDSLIKRKLIIDTINNSLTLDSNFYTDEKAVSGTNLPQPEGAKTIAVEFLSEISMLPESLDQTKTKTEFFSIRNGALIPASSLSESQLIRVDFFQGDIEERKILYKSSVPNISIYITGGEQKIVKVDYFYQERSNESATYPIKTASEAFNNLKSSKAFFVSVPQNTSEIVIKNVYLAHFAPDTTSDYLMPIVVFEGKDGFVAYVSAVKDEWISN